MPETSQVNTRRSRPDPLHVLMGLFVFVLTTTLFLGSGSASAASPADDVRAHPDAPRAASSPLDPGI